MSRKFSGKVSDKSPISVTPTLKIASVDSGIKVKITLKYITVSVKVEGVYYSVCRLQMKMTSNLRYLQIKIRSYKNFN